MVLVLIKLIYFPRSLTSLIYRYHFRQLASCPLEKVVVVKLKTVFVKFELMAYEFQGECEQVCVQDAMKLTMLVV